MIVECAVVTASVAVQGSHPHIRNVTGDTLLLVGSVLAISVAFGVLIAALLEAAMANRRATLAPYRAEVKDLRRQGVAYVASKLPEQDRADWLGRADRALPEGTRICVAGRGRGAYVSFVGRWFGANEHTIAFDSGGTQVVKLREVEWTVKEGEMGALELRQRMLAEAEAGRCDRVPHRRYAWCLVI